MKFVIDMNLSPSWEQTFNQAGIEAIHWSKIGSPRAADREIMQWALDQDHIVFTHDLDFGAILAATQAQAPSVLQVRSHDPTPDHCGRMVLEVIARFGKELKAGALISLDENRARLSILPIR
jgi:predicted nuclease of predicted toxin-antitoxin system